jgi:TetR/AcrR family transcriptional regulator, cholesterol catabolism regulator
MTERAIRTPAGDTAPGPGRRERGKQEKRARIKAAARELFATKGFTATTTQEIAARADIGTGTLFLYAHSKEEILVLVFRDEMDRVADRAFAALPRKASLLDQLVHVYATLIAFHDRDPELARVFVKEVLFVKEQNRQLVHEFVDGLVDRCAELIEAAKARGALAADVPSRMLAENCFATFLVRLQKWLGLQEPLATAEHTERLRASFALQLRGLGPRTPGSAGTTGSKSERNVRSQRRRTFP